MKEKISFLVALFERATILISFPLNILTFLCTAFLSSWSSVPYFREKHMQNWYIQKYFDEKHFLIIMMVIFIRTFQSKYFSSFQWLELLFLVALSKRVTENNSAQTATENGDMVMHLTEKVKVTSIL